ncbi:MAG TPA: M3 family oligoendopeptidase [Myxococcota bacterium]|nr:M3 family oligoendopeptidase [Myxococcota bacterium]
MSQAATDPSFDAGPAAGVRWNLSDLYAGPDDPRIDADLDAALERAGRFAERFRGRVAGLAPAELAAALDELEAISELVGSAGAYAGLLFAEDTSAPRHGALLQHVQEKSSAVQNALVFFDLEWLTLDDAPAEALVVAPELAHRRHHLESARRYRPHVLSEPEEKICEDLANTGTRAWSRLFDEVMGAARFRVGEGDAERVVSEEEVLSRLYHPDRAVRREAAGSLTAGLRENERVLAYVFNVLTQDKSTRDRLRRYAHAKQSRNLANEIDDTTVEALLAAAERGYATVQRYYRLKAKLLGLDRLEDFDRYAPLDESARVRSFDEAREIVLGAYGRFSPQMAEIAGLFFERGWIDAELRPGKRGGAFSASTVPSAHPYVLLNYTGNLRDVMTVAHELGHGVHQYLAREQGLFEQDTPLTTAETASVFGEMLVFRRLVAEERDPKVRLALLCGKLEDAFATVARQVAMTRFEESLHAARRAEGELPVERVNELWMASNRAMFGDTVHLNDHYAWWWLYVPHFVHSPFYCYAYAFGELLVLALLRRYDEEGEAFVPKYLDLLRAGGSESPPQLVARLGLDIDDPEFWNGGLEVLEAMVAEAEETAAAL